MNGHYLKMLIETLMKLDENTRRKIYHMVLGFIGEAY